MEFVEWVKTVQTSRIRLFIKICISMAYSGDYLDFKRTYDDEIKIRKNSHYEDRHFDSLIKMLFGVDTLQELIMEIQKPIEEEFHKKWYKLTSKFSFNKIWSELSERFERIALNNLDRATKNMF